MILESELPGIRCSLKWGPMFSKKLFLTGRACCSHVSDEIQKLIKSTSFKCAW